MAAAEDRTEKPGEAQPDPFVGRVIASRYKVLAFIARGGMGRIYRAEQMPLGRVVALKVLHVTAAATGGVDPGFQKRFLREAATCARLTHPNTVRVFDYGPIDGEQDAFFMAMELLEGRTLSRAIRREGPFAPVRAFRVACQIARSLREAHRLGIVHRDLKSPNVMLVAADEGESVKVLDFGLAKAVAEDTEDLTLIGSFVGSPRYMAPEQIRHGPIDHRADVYALGVILYEMLAGVPPFDAGQAIQTMMAHLNEPVPRIIERTGVSVPPPLEEIARKCLAKDPEDRFANMDEFLAAVRQVASLLSEDSGERFASEAWDPSSPGFDGAVPSASTGPPAPATRPSSVAEEPTIDAPSRLVAVTDRRRSRRAWIGTLFVVAVAAVVGVAFWPPSPRAVRVQPAAPRARVTPSRPPPVAPPAPGERPRPVSPAPDTADHGSLRVLSVPDGAEVWRGDERLGSTPLVVPLEETPVALSIRAGGHVPETLVQEAAAGEVVRTVRLRRRRGPGGEPRGADLRSPADLDIKTAR